MNVLWTPTSWFAIAAVTVACGGSVEGAGADTSDGGDSGAMGTCTYDGEQYPVGATFPASDQCNSCTCKADGTVACTAVACAPAPCVYAGKSYSAGDTFPARDGCNTCTCSPVSTISCTRSACPCDPAQEWWRHYVTKDPAKCVKFDYVCPDNTAPFSSACGCGCEQNAPCPESFDCMPPADCDVRAIQAKCPYSTVAF